MSLLSFSEAIFFPIPPDPGLSALVIAYPDKAILTTSVCTLSSALGGLIGYLIGLLIGRPLIPWLRKRFGMKVSTVVGYLRDYGPIAILIAAFTPLPFKLFTLLAGIVRVNLIGFFIAAVIGRGSRFIGVAYASLRAKSLASSLNSTYMFQILALITLILLFIILYRYWRSKRSINS